MAKKKRFRIKTEELKILPEILKIFNKYRNNPERIPDRILMAFYSLWGVERSFIALYDTDEKVLKVKAAFGFLPSELEKAIYKKGEGITGETFRLGVPLFAKEGEILNKTGFLNRALNKNLYFFTAPLKVEDEPIGVLGIFLEPERVKSVERVLETLNVVGVLIGNLFHLLEFSKRGTKFGKEIYTETLLVEKFSEKLNLMGSSETIRNVKRTVSQIAPIKGLNILVVGEDGTGKNIIANLIANMSGVKKVLFLDGKRKKVFNEKLLETLATVELVLLRRVDLLTASEQEKLLENLKRESHPRIVSTALPDIYRKVMEGAFSEELFNLLAQFDLQIPDLVYRREDIPPLVFHLVKKYSRRFGKKLEFPPEVVEEFKKVNYPRNFEDLERIIRKLFLSLPDGESVDLNILRQVEPFIFSLRKKETFEELPKLVEKEEKERIIWALEKAGFVKSKAAKMLGLTLRQLDYRIKKYGIEVKKRKN
jgi:Nif-specific regulatory protein